MHETLYQNGRRKSLLNFIKFLIISGLFALFNWYSVKPWIIQINSQINKNQPLNFKAQCNTNSLFYSNLIVYMIFFLRWQRSRMGWFGVRHQLPGALGCGRRGCGAGRGGPRATPRRPARHYIYVRTTDQSRAYEVGPNDNRFSVVSTSRKKVQNT